MVDHPHQVQRHSAQYRKCNFFRRHDEHGGQHNQRIDAHLKGPGAQAKTLLQKQCKDVYPTKIGTMTEQYQQPDAMAKPPNRAAK